MQAWFFMAYGVMGLGCLLVLFGLLGRRNWNRKLEKERALAAGRVVGYAQRTAGQRGSPVCQPTIAFTVDGEEHRANWNAIVPLSQWPVGKEVDLLYDPEHAAIVPRRVAYDVEAAASKILKAGLPPFLAARLRIGH